MRPIHDETAPDWMLGPIRCEACDGWIEKHTSYLCNDGAELCDDCKPTPEDIARQATPKPTEGGE